MDFSNATILCLGDVMLDQFMYCGAERISPEAPVPVLRVERRRSMLGGAGNVARNVTALGAKAVLLGLIGHDAAAAEITSLIEQTPGIANGLSATGERPTICKTRYFAGQQQIVRVDEEQVHKLESAERAALEGAFTAALVRADAVILSDYGKCVLPPDMVRFAIDRARAAGVPVYVDPKSHDFRQYRGATCITPNLKELAAAARLPVGVDTEVVAAATKVLAEAEAEAILVTRSEKGMALVHASGEVSLEPAQAREVFDVSGAGDTVIAMLAVAMASGYGWPEAMRLANTAAGIVVSKLGTATVELDELMLELSRDVHNRNWHGAKHFSIDEIEILVRRWKGRGLKVGFTNGCFDILHSGHVSLLAAARAQCDRLIVALNTDASVQRLKGPERPMNPLKDRASVMAAIEAVDAVVSFDEETPLDLIIRLKPDVLIKGGDYTVDTVVGADVVQQNGGRVALIDFVEGYSTTRLINAIRGEAAPLRVVGGSP